MSQESGWVRRTGGSGGERWEPQKRQYNPNDQAGNTLTGYLIDEQDRMGPRGTFKVFVIQTVNPDKTLGKIYDVSGGIVLQNTLEKISLNSFIAVVYKGKAVSKKGGSEYHIWDVFEDPSVVPFDQLGKATGPVPPAAPANPLQGYSTNPPAQNPPANNVFQQHNQNQGASQPPVQNQPWTPLVQNTGTGNVPVQGQSTGNAQFPAAPTFTAHAPNDKPPY